VGISNNQAQSAAISFLALGRHSISASYAGDSNYAAVTVSLTQVIGTTTSTTTVVTESPIPVLVNQR
jgi:hypothetical protein